MMSDPMFVHLLQSTTSQGNQGEMKVSVESKGGLPRPRPAAEELPDRAALERLGIEIDDLEAARTVAALLSRFLARGKSASRSQLKNMVAALTAVCSTEIVHDGEVDPAPHPDLAEARSPAAGAVFRRLGVDANDLEAYWRAAKHHASDASYPIEWLLAFFPAPLWPAVESVIRLGPEKMEVRLEQATMALATRTTKKNRRRRPKGSPLAYGTVDAWLTALMGLLDELVSLRTRVKASPNPALPLELLEPWRSLPARPNLRECGVALSDQDNSGPSIEEAQKALHDFARDYEANPQYPYHRLRRLLLMALFNLLGPRAGALRLANVEDFKAAVVGPDGDRCDVLEIKPGKTWDRQQIHRLPLPPLVSRWMREWIALTGREIGAQGPLFPHKKPKPGLELQHLSEVGFYGAVAGTKHGDKGGIRALIPLGDDPNLGYRPHGLRHTSEKLIQRAAAELKREHRGTLDHLTVDDFARAVLGHSLTRSISDVYRDVDRERLTFLAVPKAWEILWDTGTKRFGLDPLAIRQTREHVHGTQVAIRALDTEQTRQIERQQRLGEQAKKLSGEHLMRANIESRTLAASIAHNQQRQAELRSQLDLAIAAHEQACNQQIELPNDVDEIKHAQQVAEALGQDEHQTAVIEGPLAADLTPKDLADVYGTSEQAINRWYRKGPPPGRPEPWQPDGWEVTGPRRKVLAVEAINLEALTDQQKQTLIEVRRRRARLNHEEGLSGAA
jgi:hypothetical protein